MNYNKDTTRLSVLVVAFLLVGSAFTFLPAFASTGGAVTNAANPACATPCVNNSSPPAVTGAPYVIIGGVVTAFGVNVTNPASNAFALTSVTIISPSSSWPFSGTPTCGTLLSTVGAHSTTAVQCTSGTGTGIPPGFSQVINLGDITGPTVVASATPTTSTFSSLVVDSSGTGQSYAGSSFTEYSIAPATTVTGVTLSNSPATTFTAGGSAITVTATLSSGEVGVPLVFKFANTSYPTTSADGQTFTSTLSPSTALSSGTTTTSTWTPSNYRGDSTAISVTIGNAAFTGATASSTSIITIPGAATEVSFYFTESGTTYATDYLTNHVSAGGVLYAEARTEISLSLADAFANQVPFSSSITNVQVVSSGGDLLLAGTTLEASLICGSTATSIHCPTSGTALTFPLESGNLVTSDVNYIQSSLYGTTSTLSATITTASASYTGTSGDIITSTLDSALPAPQVMNNTQTAQSPGLDGNALIEAGTPAIVYETLSTPVVQQGVPITINFCPACSGTSTGYNTALSGFIPSETLYTNSSGMVQVSLPVNITVGATAQFNARR